LSSPNPSQGEVPESGKPLKVPPKWKCELRILRRVGLRKWLRGLRQLRRFHKSVDEMVRAEGGGHDH